MLENNSNKYAKNILIKKNKYSAENLIQFLDYNTNNKADIKKLISKLNKIVKTLEIEVLNLKQKESNNIN